MGLLDRLRTAFKKILSVNPQWKSSIAADDFRPIAPGSEAPYKGPEIPKFDPSNFHYYARDSRRNVPATVVIPNSAMSDAPRLEPSVRKSIEAEASQIQMVTGSAEAAVDSMSMKPPTKKYQYTVAQFQPSASGHFTITNYT